MQRISFWEGNLGGGEIACCMRFWSWLVDMYYPSLGWPVELSNMISLIPALDSETANLQDRVLKSSIRLTTGQPSDLHHEEKQEYGETARPQKRCFLRGSWL
jgi:hypothetical protein